jgi:hypothetical protein
MSTRRGWQATVGEREAVLRHLNVAQGADAQVRDGQLWIRPTPTLQWSHYHLYSASVTHQTKGHSRLILPGVRLASARSKCPVPSHQAARQSPPLPLDGGLHAPVVAYWPSRPSRS